MIRGLYLVLDPQATGGRSPVGVAAAALREGIDALQWRQKGGSVREKWEDLRAVREQCRRAGVPFLVNDRVDLALAVSADGVHVGQDDIPAATARSLLPRGILGVSITDPSQVKEAECSGADYLGAGPIFTTVSKPDADPVLGLSGLQQIRAMTELPIVAIGGIDSENAASVLAAGADAAAVISAICSAGEVAVATRALRLGLAGVAP